MTIRLSQPQATLLTELRSAGSKGVFKSTAYSPADNLVTIGYARWLRKYDNGRSGCLVITQKGVEFKEGRL
ncbi:hypothetical protein G6L16_008935 [Agrobacterium tumefaciens]|uniref:hypothetical protein n=1 Tax=Agrobacterium tumefaciens TaxID=358 RepID=UPI00157418D1|nr:hypothetical protein [Agrobacterium tumefaciens]NSZ63463.1 hypothetical protein [Agrobacterium tumefaciens]NTA69833.1 hypothetical protein [Agrobacterium tumefaciens]WIE36978.1 hypothetical protein G6L16_008935 [Agrobacterium tumefaciens]